MMDVGTKVQFMGEDDVYRNIKYAKGVIRYRILQTLALVDFSKEQNVDGGWFVGIEDLATV